MAARGCGNRVYGGVYVVCDTAPAGKEIEWYVVDPPLPVPSKLHLGPRGVRPLNDSFATHVADWVGAKFYPNVADFLEEARRQGVSRRIPKTFDFSLLSQYSKIILAHSRGSVLNYSEYWSAADRQGQRIPCVKEGLGTDIGLVSDGGRIFEASAGDMGQSTAYECCTRESGCAGIYWWDLDPPAPKREEFEPVIRPMPSFHYEAHARSSEVRPIYVPSFFAAFPISRLVIIRNPYNLTDTEELRARIAAKTWLRVDLEDE